ncbi:MAG: Tim44 domain-containing protein [Deltaproteobacteria bacterium]|nr:Tim44 domain-containing protein [Deltaproteobacteria bacterium]
MSAFLLRIQRWFAQRPWLLAGLGVALLMLLVTSPAWARVGGGESFSSGGGGSSGGSDSDADLIFFLLWLCIEHPAIGVPLTLIVIVVAIVKKASGPKKQEWTAGAPSSEQYVAPVQRGARRQLERIREQDPEFSTVLFEDFLYALYAAAHEARGGGQLATLSAYFAAAARARFHPRSPGMPRLTQVKDVVVGSMRVTQVLGLEPASPAVRVTVRFETNFTELVEASGGGKPGENPIWAIEVWHLSRKRGLVSRPPERASKIGCPSCGAALTEVRGNTCSYCQQVVDTGAFDWRVDGIDLVGRVARPPAVSLGGEVESGTDLPTLTAPDALPNLQTLEARDPALTLDAFRARAEMVFRELQAAWSAREWLRVRPYVSDSLFQMQLYWIEGFKRQGLRNVIDQVQVQRLEVASVVCDAHYDAITVRIFASCLDFVQSEDGKLVRGSKSRPTRFSEYWTFIRGSGRTGAPSAEKKCPNCGAPQQINQAGSCEYCHAKITSGEFDWILSRIEQDDVYAG